MKQSQQLTVNSKAQASHYAAASNIDPKYVADIEANLGKLRLENANLVSVMGEFEAKIGGLEVTNQIQGRQLEVLNKEITDITQIKNQIRQLEFELESKKNENKAISEQMISTRQQLFTSTFEKSAFEANLQENNHLRSQHQMLAGSLDALKQQFDEYCKLVGTSPDEVRYREQANNDLHTVVLNLIQRLRQTEDTLVSKESSYLEKCSEVENLRREIDGLKEINKIELEREKLSLQRERTHEQMYKSQHAEEMTDLNIVKRKADRLTKENELLRKQNQDLKSQLETTGRNPSMYTSGYHESERGSIQTRAITVRKDTNVSKELQMKEMEVQI